MVHSNILICKGLLPELCTPVTFALNVPFVMFFLNMVNYPLFFPLMSTFTWDTFLTLRGTWGFYLNHVIPHRASKSYGWGGVVVVVAHKILVSAPVPLELI